MFVVPPVFVPSVAAEARHHRGVGKICVCFQMVVKERTN